MNPPTISPVLVRFLKELYPDRAPDGPTASRDEEMWRGGQVSVVRYLEELLNEQQNGEKEESESYIRV